MNGVHVNLTSPKPLLYRVWESEKPEARSTRYTLLSATSKGVAVILALAARIPAINVARDAAGNNQAYGWTLATINLFSYGSLIAWSFLKMVDNETKALSDSEKKLIKENNINFSIYTKSSLAALGLISQIPFNYMAYEFNGDNGPLMAALITADSALPIYSLNLSVKESLNLYRNKWLSDEGKEIKKIKENLIDFLKNEQKNLPETYLLAMRILKTNTNSELADTIPLLQALPENRNKIEEETPTSTSLERSWREKFLRLAVQAGGYTSTAGRLMLYSVLGYQGSSRLFSYMFDENENSSMVLAPSIIISTLVVGSNAYLLKDVIVNRALEIFDSLKDRITGKQKKSPVEQLRPKLNFFLKFLVLGITGLSYSTPFALSRKTFENDQIFGLEVPGLQTSMEMTSIAAVLILVSHSLRYFVDELVEGYICKKGSQEEKDLIAFTKKLKKFIEVLKDSSLTETKNFISYMKSTVPLPLYKEEEDTMENLLHKILEKRINQWISNLESSSSDLETFLVEP